MKSLLKFNTSSLKQILSIVFIFLIVGLIFTYPLLNYLNKGIIYSHYPREGYEVVSITYGDHLQLFYCFWLFKNTILRGDSPFVNPYEFSYYGKRDFFLQVHLFPALFFLLSPLGDIFAFNSLVILSFVLAGGVTYLLVRFYTKNSLAALAGGIVFALAPYRLGQVGIRNNGFLSFLIPLFIFFLELAIERRSRIYGALAGITFFAAVSSEYHLGYYMILILPFYLTFRFFFPLNEYTQIDNVTVNKPYNKKTKIANILGRLKEFLKSLWPFILIIFLSVIYTYLMKKINLDSSILHEGRTLDEVSLYSPAFKDMFLRNNPLAEKFIYVGPIVMGLAVYSLIKGLTKPKKEERLYEKSNLIFYGLIFSVTYILSFGPNLKILPLYNLFYKFIPYFNYPRFAGRIVILSFLALSVLVGFSIKYLLDSSIPVKKIKGKVSGRRKLRYLVVIIIFFLLLVDYFPSKPKGIDILKKENEVYEIVKNNLKTDETLLELPIWPGVSVWSSIYEYYVTLHGKKIVNGYSPAVSRRYLESVYKPLSSLNFGEAGEDQYDLLKKLKVRYVIFHKEAFPTVVSPYPPSFTLKNLKTSNYLRVVKDIPPITLFEIINRPVIGSGIKNNSIIGNVFEAENLPKTTGRVIKDENSSNGYAVLAERKNDRPGYFALRPYRYFPSGNYKAIFRLKSSLDNMDLPLAALEVNDVKGENILVRKRIFARDFSNNKEYHDFIISYTLEKPSDLEFKVYLEKDADLIVDYIYILFREQQDPLDLIEAEDLWYTGETEEDAEASGGKTICITNQKSKDFILFGPWRRYPPGKYRASYRMKLVKEELEKDIISLMVTTDNSKRVISTSNIGRKDFNVEGVYQEFPLEFTLESDEILEFKAYHMKNSDLCIDKITIERVHE